MAEPRARVLLVEDTASLAAVYAEYLRSAGHAAEHARTAAEAVKLAAADPPDAVLLDVRLPDGDGLSVLRELRRQNPDIAVVVMTAHGSVATAVEAMRGGAADFLVKPFAAERLAVTLANALERAALKREVRDLTAGRARSGFQGFVGAAPAMQAVYRVLETAAQSRATVFITGESGTGKELAAEAVHNLSPRRAGPFIAINCAAIPRDLIESEIFGHVRGAFTGAVADRIGAAQAADGGTLFLDELCEMDLSLQGKLLRFIQSGTFQPVGSTQVRRTDVRFVCATNRDPLEEVKAGRFREDLYYRLHVVPVRLPPLRERGEDVVAIAEAMLARSAAEEGKAFRGFTEEAKAALLAHRWPGNVRELENVVRTAVVLNSGERVEAAMLPLRAAALPAPSAPPTPAPVAPLPMTGDPARLIRPLADVEREAIERAVLLCDGNIPKAAAFLGVSPSTLYRKRASWGESAA
ncbi:sigma-54 dependent transcriptional regulator [Roseomonas sp. AR75]|uniref:sigma-54-dependent transcriptional regulator n=1 Tax=Roseomonas sp. AR75 TaxID=2562311 RepID=UPI0010C08F16|nr:sigma-54 dependent transcriptional regulator [Roseomonas sp. AR75]